MSKRQWKTYAHGCEEYASEDAERVGLVRPEVMVAHNLAVIVERLEALVEAVEALKPEDGADIAVENQRKAARLMGLLDQLTKEQR